jgi:hypothetical protein
MSDPGLGDLLPVGVVGYIGHRQTCPLASRLSAGTGALPWTRVAGGTTTSRTMPSGARPRDPSALRFEPDPPVEIAVSFNVYPLPSERERPNPVIASSRTALYGISIELRVAAQLIWALI